MLLLILWKPVDLVHLENYSQRNKKLDYCDENKTALKIKLKFV